MRTQPSPRRRAPDDAVRAGEEPESLRRAHKILMIMMIALLIFITILSNNIYEYHIIYTHIIIVLTIQLIIRIIITICNREPRAWTTDNSYWRTPCNVYLLP